MSKENNKKKGVKDVGYRQFNDMPKIQRGNYSVFDIEDDLEKAYSQPNKVENQENKEIVVEDTAKSRRCGSLDKFDAYQKAYEDAHSDFITVSYGSTKKIIYGKNSFVFNGVRGTKKPSGIHLISYVKKDIDNLIRGEYNPETDTYECSFKIPKIPEKKPYLTFIHHKNLDWYGTGMEALAIDADHCYWRSAYLLKHITEDTYQKGIAKKEYKDGRLIAIGTLGKVLTVRKYEKGVKVEEYTDDTEYLKYGGFYWAVITKVNAMMLELWNELKEDFLMFLTDCVVIDPSKRDVALAIMHKHGYGTKEYRLVFTELTDTKVAWVTDKGESKYIVHNRMLSKSERERNKENNGNENKPDAKTVNTHRYNQVQSDDSTEDYSTNSDEGSVIIDNEENE
jgi:hypothetical protein